MSGSDLVHKTIFSVKKSYIPENTLLWKPYFIWAFIPLSSKIAKSTFYCQEIHQYQYMAWVSRQLSNSFSLIKDMQVEYSEEIVNSCIKATDLTSLVG